MKRIFHFNVMLLAMICSVVAQTNTIIVPVADYTGSSIGTNALSTVTLLSPNPRTVNNMVIRQNPITAQTDTNSTARFTNLIWGKYRLEVGPLSRGGGPAVVTPFTFYVGTNTLGEVQIASLITNSAALPPNPGTNYYTVAQVDALLASVSGGTATNVNYSVGGVLSGITTNAAFSAEGTNAINDMALRQAQVVASTNLPAGIVTNGTLLATSNALVALIIDGTNASYIYAATKAQEATNGLASGAFTAVGTIATVSSNSVLQWGTNAALQAALDATNSFGRTVSVNMTNAANSFTGTLNATGGNVVTNYASGTVLSTILAVTNVNGYKVNYGATSGGAVVQAVGDGLGTFFLKTNGNVSFNGVLVYTNPALGGSGFTGNGSGLTNLNASSLTSGTLPDASLSSNIPTKTDATNIATAQIAAGIQYSNLIGTIPSKLSPFGLSGTNVIVDPENGALQRLVLTGPTTISVTNLPLLTNYTITIRLEIVGSNAVTWAAAYTNYVRNLSAFSLDGNSSAFLLDKVSGLDRTNYYVFKLYSY